MTDLGTIKKALEGVTPDAWRYRMKNWSEQYWHHFSTEPRCKEADEIWEPLYSPSSLASTIESLQRENEMLRASRDGYAKQRDEILRLYNEERLAWRPMDSAPKDGKHCILSIPSGGFAYTVQGAFMGGKWINALNVDAEPLAWMPNVMLPDAYCPWKRPFSVPLASTGGEHHAE